MSKLFQKIVKNINSLNYCYVLSENKDYVIVGLKIKVTEHRAFKLGIFNNSAWNVERDFPVFFMVKEQKSNSDLVKLFNEKSIPVLSIVSNKEVDESMMIERDLGLNSILAQLRPNATLEEFQKILDDFVGYTFGYNG